MNAKTRGTRKPVTLRREQVRVLTSGDLQHVVGGLTPTCTKDTTEAPQL